jgi:hypothetical protein
MPGLMPGLIGGLRPGAIPGLFTGLRPGTMPGLITGRGPGPIPGLITGLGPGAMPGLIMGLAICLAIGDGTYGVAMRSSSSAAAWQTSPRISTSSNC